MRAIPALVTVAAIVAPLAGAGCYTVPALETDGGTDGATHPSDGSSGSGSSSGSSSGSGASSGSGSSSGGPGDASTHGDAAACGGAVLCSCMNAMDCTTALCAQPNTFAGQAIFTAAGIAAGSGFCTKECCSSADCPTGSVCWASGEGGQYCVDPKWIGRSKPAAPPTLEGGFACNTGSQCNSGLCVSGACADTCCSFSESSTNCASPNASCVFGTFPGMQGIDSHFAPHCGARPGNTQTGNPCTVNADCQGGLCYPFGGTLGDECTEACRNSPDCGGGSYCDWDVAGGSGTDVYAACFPQVMGAGYGASCSSNSACASNVCNGANCSAPCFADGDCSGGPQGWHCSPGVQLIFQTAGTYSVLSCGP